MPTPLEPAPDGSAYVVTIGTFDGVHLGHRRLIAATQAEAARQGLPSAVVTFDRHPAEIVRPDAAPKLLTGLEHKVELLRATGVDRVVVLRFDEQLAAQSAEDFVDDVLIGSLGAEVVVVGANFRFGHRQLGDVELLRALGATRRLRTIGVELFDDGAPAGAVSSAGIRALVAAGDLADAARLLDRPHEVRGENRSNDERRLVRLARNLLLPPPGHYVARVGAQGNADLETVATVEANCAAVRIAAGLPAALRAEERLAVQFFERYEQLNENAPRNVGQ